MFLAENRGNFVTIWVVITFYVFQFLYERYYSSHLNCVLSMFYTVTLDSVLHLCCITAFSSSIFWTQRIAHFVKEWVHRITESFRLKKTSRSSSLTVIDNIKIKKKLAPGLVWCWYHSWFANFSIIPNRSQKVLNSYKLQTESGNGYKETTEFHYLSL